MLLNLHVKNLALIDEADVEFGGGLHVLSGETGAGKSILIGSMNLALGEKVPKDVIRNHAEYAYVEMVFQLEPEKQEALSRIGIEAEDGLLILSRKMMPARSVSRINGETVPASKLRAVTSQLIDIHGQHDHQSLLYPSRHLEILDLFGKEEILSMKKNVREAFVRHENLLRELSRFSMDEESRRREISFLEFEIQELEEAALSPGEEERLTAEYKRLLHGKELAEGISAAKEAVNGEEGGASEAVGQALHRMQPLLAYDSGLESFYGQLLDIEGLLSDLGRELADYVDGAEVEEERLDELQRRLDVIHNMKGKYGGSEEAALEYLKRQRRRLEELRDYENRRNGLVQEEAEAKKTLTELCGKLSRLRKKVSGPLIEEIRKHLLDLNFLNVDFSMDFRNLSAPSSGGADEVEFMISLNPGEKRKPLGQVASGGELSRIMLAIKTVLAEKDDIPTLVFDEIDAGISGRTAGKVGEKLRKIGKSHQVICISHLPQIVAMAEVHYQICKESDERTARTVIRRLKKEESVQELARLIGGVEITETTLKSAREMKELAESTK